MIGHYPKGLNKIANSQASEFQSNSLLTPSTQSILELHASISTAPNQEIEERKETNVSNSVGEQIMPELDTHSSLVLNERENIPFALSSSLSSIQSDSSQDEASHTCSDLSSSSFLSLHTISSFHLNSLFGCIEPLILSPTLPFVSSSSLANTSRESIIYPENEHYKEFSHGIKEIISDNKLTFTDHSYSCNHGKSLDDFSDEGGHGNHMDGYAGSCLIEDAADKRSSFICNHFTPHYIPPSPQNTSLIDNISKLDVAPEMPETPEREL
ncbi:unnamed protein product [Protopolystoma xenopodis]|uniref:Uncharacterized protein n=1 Tax=Protopolystoma xenopodis TaxID=117903 RepID=A0A448XMP3_9PLAT|nr:unnamed protein product [Protopolystoma xenopodis]